MWILLEQIHSVYQCQVYHGQTIIETLKSFKVYSQDLRYASVSWSFLTVQVKIGPNDDVKLKHCFHIQYGAFITTVFAIVTKPRACFRYLRSTNVVFSFVLKYTKEPQTNRK